MTIQRNDITTYMFEPTNLCNLDCPLCPTGNLSSQRSKGLMDPDLFEHVLDAEEITEKMIMLWGWGEPLLHPELSIIVAAAKKRNNCVEVQTNGTAPTESYKLLLNAGLDTLTISLDGLTDETLYPLRGKQLSSEVVRKRIAELVSIRSAVGSTTNINVQCIATGYNEQEIPDIRNWALTAAKADKFMVKTLCLGDLTIGKLKHYLPKDPSLRRYVVDEQGISLPARLGGACNFIRHVRVVLWNFTVVPCCYDFDGAYALGNILSDSPMAEFNTRYVGNEVRICEICPEMKVADIFVNQR